MDQDLAWPLAGLGISAIAGVASAIAAEQPMTAIIIATAAVLAGLALWAAWRKVCRRVDDARRTLQSMADQPPAPVPVRSRSVEHALAQLDDASRRLRERLERNQGDLAKKSANLGAILDGLNEPVLATGGDTILLCNRAAEALVGAAPGGLSGLRFREVFTRPELQSMHSAARQGLAEQRQVRLTTPVGVRTFDVSASPLPAASGPGIFGAVLFLRDVTALAQAVQMRSDFVANASHELRTPVAAIRGAAETLQEVAGDDPAMRDRLVSMIVQHAQRLEEMTIDLMDLSRLESPEMPVNLSPVSMEDLRETLLAGFESVCRERKLSISCDLEPALAVFQTDPKLLSLILRNLIDNATKYAHEGTTIRFTARRVQNPDSASDTDHCLARFEVADRGIGIPLAQQERVFERFYQIDSARTAGTIRRGTGLGLAIVKHAAKALGGRVGLESNWGEGTRVWVELPVVPLEHPGGAG